MSLQTPVTASSIGRVSPSSVASRLFREGRNIVQVQRWLGHHAPSFTLDTYVHLLDADLGEPLALDGPESVERDEAVMTSSDHFSF